MFGLDGAAAAALIAIFVLGFVISLAYAASFRHGQDDEDWRRF
jgi:hypothetical protein